MSNDTPSFGHNVRLNGFRGFCFYRTASATFPAAIASAILAKS
jgi:hypothetical protein